MPPSEWRPRCGPEALLDWTQNIEREMGRQRPSAGDLAASILTCCCWATGVRSPELEIPHPRMTFRRFVSGARGGDSRRYAARTQWLDGERIAAALAAVANYWPCLAHRVGVIQVAKRAARLVRRTPVVRPSRPTDYLVAGRLP